MSIKDFNKNSKPSNLRNKGIEESSFVSNLNEIENKYVDSLLNGDLKQIYKGVQLKCKDFRNQMFAKNLVQLDKDYVSTISINNSQYRPTHRKAASCTFQSYKNNTVSNSNLRNMKSQTEIILDEVIAE